MRSYFVAPLLLALFVAASARADSRAVILPPRTETGVPEEAGDKIADYVATYLRDVRHLQVTPPLTADEGIPQAARECWTTSCVLQYKTTFNADFAVVIVLFADHGKFASFNIVVVVDEGAEYSASESITSATSLEQASIAVLESALRKRDHGPGPWLRVLADANNVADEATVEIDGKVVGKVPYVDRIRAGDHFVIVRKEGYEPYRETVAITPGAGSEEELHLTLTPLATKPVAVNGWRARARDRRGVADWVTGGVLIALGAPLAASGAYSLIKNGDCAEHATSGGMSYCSGSYSMGGAEWTRLVAGGLAAVGGAAIMIAAPIGAMLHADKNGTTAALTYRGEF